MSQPAGIAINNSHLLRAAMLFMVLGVIGPGLFQLQPPQWFGGSGDMAEPGMVAMVPGPVPDIVPDIVPEIAPEVVAESVPAPDIASGPGEPGPETVQADPPDGAAVASSPAANPSAEIVGAVVERGTEQTAEIAVPPSVNSAPETHATVPERPAVAARKSRPEPTPDRSPAADGIVQSEPWMETKPETQVASRAMRASRLPAIPAPTATPTVVARDFAKTIPQSHLGLPVKRQKESFIAITLPLILAANEEISQRRSAIIRAVSRDDRAAVERWAKLYRVETDGRTLAEIQKQLLLRADFVPVSLALAQAAIESGWGTSRFALQGNALFGQWAWQKDAGMTPARASNSNAVVRSFPNLFGSVRAYMHNLNTHPRYAAFRARRHLLRGRTKSDLGYQLSNFLDGYAEIGEAYVAKLKTLIRSNDLGRYETARLR